MRREWGQDAASMLPRWWAEEEARAGARSGTSAGTSPSRLTISSTPDASISDSRPPAPSRNTGGRTQPGTACAMSSAASLLRWQSGHSPYPKNRDVVVWCFGFNAAGTSTPKPRPTTKKVAHFAIAEGRTRHRRRQERWRLAGVRVMDSLTIQDMFFSCRCVSVADEERPQPVFSC